MAEDVPPSTQAAAAAAAEASGRGDVEGGWVLESVRSGVLFVCLFSVCLKRRPLAVLFCFRRRVGTVSFACVHTEKRAASSEARRYGARRLCNYHSGVKSGLIRGGESRADQKDLGEDRTKNVKSCSLLKHRDVNLSESTLMFSEENLIKARVTKMVSEDDLTSVAFPPAVSLYFFFFFFGFFFQFFFKPASIYLPGTARSTSSLFALRVRPSEYQ